MSKVVKAFKQLIRGKKVTETYTSYQMSAVEIIEDDILDQTRRQLILKYVQKNMSGKDYVMDYGNTGAAQFFQYYLGGIYDYEDELPTVSVGQQLVGVVGTDEVDGEAYQYTNFEVYPIVMLRNEYFNVTDYKNTSTSKPSTITQKRYDETVDMLERLGLSLEDIIAGISDNPQISNVKDAFFLFGVSPSNKSAIVSQCLYKIFEEVYTTKPLAPNAYTYWNKFTVDFEEGAYNQYMEWVPRATTVTNGRIGTVGTYDHNWTLVDTYNDNPFQQSSTVSFRVLKQQAGAGSVRVGCEAYVPELGGWVRLLYESTMDNIPWVNNFSPKIGDTIFNFDESRFSYIFYNVKSTTATESWATFDGMALVKAASVVPQNYYRLTMRHQFAENQYRTITIDDLFSQTYITTGVGSKIDQNVTSEDLVIPLPIKVVESLSFMERTDLLSHSFYLTFYAVSTQTITYYKGGVFKGFLKVIGVIIAVIITVVAPPAGAAFGSVLAGGAIGTAIASTLANLFINYLVGMALSIALKFVIKIAGNDSTLAMILSAVVMVLATYATGGFNGALDSLSSTLKTAMKLSEIPAKLVDIYVSSAMQEINDSMNALGDRFNTLYNVYNDVSDRYDEILKSFNTGISTRFLVGLQHTESYGNSVASPWLLSPSAFYYAAIQGQYNFNSLYSNDVESFASNSLRIGLLDT